jgi:hypothetical protein
LETRLNIWIHNISHIPFDTTKNTARRPSPASPA